MPKHFLFGLKVLFLIFIISFFSYFPPKAKNLGAPLGEFSSARASLVLLDLLKEEKPHPSGSEENEKIRDLIIEKIIEMGLEPEVQSFETTIKGKKETLFNVITKMNGSNPESQKILLSSHYDSVVEAPGAADDMHAVAATFEIMRIFSEGGKQLKHDLVIMFNDGEEIGLLGAKAFMDGHPWAKEIGYVINMEARGTSGPSLMFETSENSSKLIEIYGSSVTHPRSSSIFYEIYKRLPNGTDFLIYKKYGLKGFNFAFIGNAQNYHTENDNIKNLNFDTLQHQGQNVFQVLHALQEMNLSEIKHDSNNVYFDLIGKFFFSWPEKNNIPLSVTTMLLLYFVLMRLGQLKALTWKKLGWGSLAFPGLVFGTIGVGIVFDVYVFESFQLYGWWPKNPAPSIFLLFLIPCFVFWPILKFLRKRATFWGLWGTTWRFFCGLSILMAFILPGAIYLFLIPSLIAVISGLILTSTKTISGPKAKLFASIPALIALGLIWIPTGVLLYDAIGFYMRTYVSLIFAMTLAGLIPLSAPIEKKN